MRTPYYANEYNPSEIAELSYLSVVFDHQTQVGHDWLEIEISARLFLSDISQIQMEKART
jgi:hypothetical protein